MEPGAIRRTNADHETGDPLSSETTVDYDPFSPSTLADPMRACNEVRERCPVHQFTDFSPPFATITRYDDDVVAVLKDTDIWSSWYGQTSQFTRGRGLNQDPPDHTEFRKLFQLGFPPAGDRHRRLLPGIHR